MSHNYAQTPELSLVDYDTEARIVTYQRGYRLGFSTGIAEKAWLQRYWPALTGLVGLACFLIGLLL